MSRQLTARTCHRLLYAALAASCLLLSVTVAPMVAAAATTTGAISQSYSTADSGITQGTLLSLASKGSTVVVPAGTANASGLVGIAASKPLLELTNPANENGHASIQVVVSGSTDALVSDLNGPVSVGDKITASPVSGIGMKASAGTEVVGTAQAGLSSVRTVTKTFKGQNGTTVQAEVGLLPIAVNVAYYNAAQSAGSVSAYVPPFLQNLANSITGKAVSPLRVLIGAVTLLLGFVTIIIMLYTGIRSGVISLGRNPLAENALRRGMIDILITAVGVLIVIGAVVAATISA